MFGVEWVVTTSCRHGGRSKNEGGQKGSFNEERTKNWGGGEGAMTPTLELLGPTVLSWSQ